MEIIKIILLSFFSVAELFILTKIMGNRQMSQLSMFDYINGITIGSIAAEMATSLETSFWHPFTAMIVYAAVSVAISYGASKSIKFRKVINGKPHILMDNKKLYKNNFSRSKVDINEFLTECRNQGYFNINDIQTAVLEANGKLSILPVADKRPVSPYDMNMKPEQEKMPVNIIVDGQIMYDELRHSGKNDVWLKNQLDMQNVKLSDVLLAFCDESNNLSVYTKNEK